MPRRVAIASALLIASLGISAGHAGGDPRPASPAFVTEISPLLQKQGCSSAYCHGSATGRGGFKLSLFGGDPRADYDAITNELGARRVDLRDPEQSLVLRKPSLQTRHGGGRKLPKDGPGYRIVVDWIAAGAPFANASAMTSAPLALELAGDRLTVLQGRDRRDVTHLALLSSSDESVAGIDADGRVDRRDRGVAWIVARVGGTQATLPVVTPYGPALTAPSSDEFSAAWLGPLGELGLHPGGIAEPRTLARRLHLDLAGRLPTPAEVMRFLELPEDERVARTVDSLLAGPEFVTTFTDHVARWLEVGPADSQLRALVKQRIAGTASLTDLVAELVQGKRWLERREDPRDRAEHFARALLGVRIGCARCHDSPIDRWKRSEHLAFSASFTSPRPKPGGGTAPGVLFDPQTGQEVVPGRDIATLLATERTQLARNFANRIFATLLGRGLVNPVDDHRATNPTWFAGLLEHLAARFTTTNGDLRALVREIATSRLYALESRARADGMPELVRWLAMREAKELDAQALLAAIASALQVELQAPRLPEEPLARELALLNGGWLADAITKSDVAGLPLDQIYDRILTRAPSAAEAARFAGEDPRDVAFALLCSREFRSLR